MVQEVSTSCYGNCCHSDRCYRYEFNESDLRMGCDTLDTWLDLVAQGRTNLPPDKVPWSAFRTLLSQCIYGGRIDNEFDQVCTCDYYRRVLYVCVFRLMYGLDYWIRWFWTAIFVCNVRLFPIR